MKRVNFEARINIIRENLSNLRFADDIILFAESEEQLAELFKKLIEEGKKHRMKMNKKKTKTMCFKTR